MSDPSPVESVTGVVLAGGKSSRMGSDKAFLRLGERALIEACVATLKRCFARNLIIANQPERFQPFRLPVRADDTPGLGPLGGICTALRHVDTPAVFVVACDMPFLDADLIRSMADALGEFDAVVTKAAGRFEPLHAAYHRRALSTLEARIAAGDYSVQGLLGVLKARIFTTDELARFPGWERSLLNVNTPEELERARKLKQDSRSGDR